jgi:hypothetical protein
LYIYQHNNSTEWSVFLPPERVTPFGCLKQEGLTIDATPFYFLHSIIQSMLPTFRSVGKKSQNRYGFYGRAMFTTESCILLLTA